MFIKTVITKHNNLLIKEHPQNQNIYKSFKVPQLILKFQFKKMDLKKILTVGITAAGIALYPSISHESLNSFSQKAFHLEKGKYEKSVNQKQILKDLRKIHSSSNLPDYISSKFIEEIVFVESGYNPYLTSKKGAKGLMQIIEQTWTEMDGKEELFFDVEENLRVGIKYLEYLENFCKNNYKGWDSISEEDKLKFISAAYNGGPNRLKARKWNIRKMPYETRKYVKNVMKRMEEDS